MTKASLIRSTFNWGWLTGSEVQSIIIKAGAWQYPGTAGMAQAELRVLPLVPKMARKRLASRVLKPIPTVTHLLQQGHTYCNKSTHSNSAIHKSNEYKVIIGWSNMSQGQMEGNE